MKNYGWLLIASSLILSACGKSEEASPWDQTPEVDPIAVVVETPTPTPVPSATPVPSPTATPAPSATPVATPTPDPSQPEKRSRIFVSSQSIAFNSATRSGTGIRRLDLVCEKEAKAAGIRGNYAAVVASIRYAFPKQYSVEGKIYQVVDRKEIAVAESFEGMVRGKTQAVYATANGKIVGKRGLYVWTGQKNLNEPASDDLNCNDYRTVKGESIVGVAGREGSEAFAERYLKCTSAAHVYCIQYR